MRKLDPTKVPGPLVHLVPMAERWGVSDEGDRERAVDNASPAELETLAYCLDDVNDDLDSWLCGPAADAEEPSEEFVSFVNLLMAMQSANLRLRKMQEAQRR